MNAPATKYTFHVDPGHGWLEVTRAELERLNIASKITAYSYQRGPLVYLEEDCDFSTFYQAKQARGESVPYEHRHHADDAPMRGYSHYTASRA